MPSKRYFWKWNKIISIFDAYIWRLFASTLEVSAHAPRYEVAHPSSFLSLGREVGCIVWVYGLVVWMGPSAFPRGLASRHGGRVYSCAGHGRWCVPCFGSSTFVPVWVCETGHLNGGQCLDRVIHISVRFKRLWMVIHLFLWFLHPHCNTATTISIPERCMVWVMCLCTVYFESIC